VEPVAADEEVFDSPTGWVAKHIKEYVESGGEKGHRWQGVSTLLLTTRGRKTGTLRRTALIYGRDGDSYVVVASIGGAPKHPKWYLNLVTEPGVELQVGPRIISGRARTTEGDDRTRLWREMAKIWPQYDRYQEKTRRQIPVVIIDPV
jgi:deazaflavin-dependent oxidoreductase (nitroreductase family)